MTHDETQTPDPNLQIAEMQAELVSLTLVEADYQRVLVLLANALRQIIDCKGSPPYNVARTYARNGIQEAMEIVEHGSIKARAIKLCRYKDTVAEMVPKATKP